MRKWIIALLTAVFMGGVGAAHAGTSDLISDGGFELLAHANAPDVDTSPWTTDEVWHEDVQRGTTTIRSGAHALRWKAYWQPDSVWQNLGVQVKAGEDYDVDLWHAPTEFQVNQWFVPLSFDVSVWTSPTVGGTYTAVATRTVTSTNTADVYQNFTDTFTAAELSGVVGEYMQLRISKIAAGDHRLHIDDVAFFGPIPDEGSLVVSPASGLDFNFTEASAVVSNSLDLSYIAGGLGSNMVVSSISIVDETGPGFSVSPSSLTLTTPAPASEPVWVEFDNGTAGLTPNGVASANVQIIWNDASSASSTTSSVPVSATYLGAHVGNIIAAFYSEQTAWKNYNAGFLGEADIAMPDVDTAVSGIEWATNKRGSDDTSYGTQLGNAPVTGGAAQGSYGNYNDNKILIAITNNSAAAIELESVHFDYGRAWNADPADYVTVTIDGDLDIAGPFVLTNVYGTVQTGDSAVDLNDCDVDLTGLADPYLEVGEVVTFEFQLNMTADIGILDNVAVLGKGTLPAVVNVIAPLDIPDADTRWVSLGVTGLEDAPVSQPIDLIFGEGELMTNVIITGVSISNVIGSGMSSAGPFPVVLPTPDVIHSAVFDLVFDNSVANLAAGERTEHVVTIEYTEPGRGALTSEFIAYGCRPDDVPTNGILAMFDTDILVPDTAYTGLLGEFISGRFEVSPNLPGKGKGSLDNTYGTLATSRGDGTNDTWCILINGEDDLQVATLVITNTTTAAFELSEFRFDMGRWYAGGATDFSLAVSGDVTTANLLVDEPTTELGWNNHDFDDHDLDLTGLTDHTLAAGESVTFTWTCEYESGNIYLAMFIDNVALMGSVDKFGGWAASEGLTEGVNDDPSDNPDGDGKDNLSEYALGTDPLVVDGANTSNWQTEEDGADWLYYVHAERQDDAELAYDVGTKIDLVYDPSWNMDDAEEMGRTDGAGLWKNVTNRTEITEGDNTKYMGLEVQQN